MSSYLKFFHGWKIEKEVNQHTQTITMRMNKLPKIRKFAFDENDYLVEVQQ